MENPNLNDKQNEIIISVPNSQLNKDRIITITEQQEKRRRIFKGNNYRLAQLCISGEKPIKQ